MRYIAGLGLVALLPALVAAQPIKMVTLDRKEPVLYDKDIEPILVQKCQFCHSGSLQEGKLDMASYESLLKGGKHGPPIVAGKSAESLLIQLAGRVQKPLMPPKGEQPLVPEELALLKLWIDQGAKPPESRRQRQKIVLESLPAPVHPVRALAIRPDKAVLAAGRANQIHLYETASGAYLRSLHAPGLTTPDGKPLPAAHSAIVEALAYSPDNRFLASGAFQEVFLWEGYSGALWKRLSGFADRVVCLAFSPDAKWLATGGGAPTEDGEIKIFDVDSCRLITEIKNGHSDTVFGVCFSPDGTKLATCGADKFVKVFEVPSGKLLKSFEGHTHHVLDVAWKADGKLLVSGGADNVIKVWDYEKGEQVRTFGNLGKQVTRLMFKGTTSEIVMCSGDPLVRFWNVDNGSGGVAFSGNSDFLYAVGVTSDGKLVAAGGEEGIVRLYNGTNGQLLKALVPPGITLPGAKK
ncbi:MAG TPA: c-type cytochrome domain-containing protein [Gemmataceae bacterium]|nr:c-type cytochrome domain-containing protein [Gemmataceae bacterium]